MGTAGGSDTAAKRRFPLGPSLTAGTVMVLIVLAAALFPGLFTHYSPTRLDPQSMLLPPSAQHWFGTDNYGRDLFARVVYGARLDLSIGIAATIVPFLFGSLLGLLAGYYGGRLDALIMRILDITMAFPFLVLAIIVAAIIGSGIRILLVSSWLVAWTEYTRLIRSEVLVVKNLDYIQSAVSLGYGDSRIILRHILPNVIGSAIVYGASDMVISMMSAASLSFLGLGVQPPTPEWGSIISGGKSFLASAPWITIIPGLVLAFTGWGFSLIGDGLSDMLRTRGN
jgi:peptide/nickel transport system permease protein